MELPFYLNFKDFENHYYNNLEKWFEAYYNTSEIDYLKALAELYCPYLYYNFANNRLQADASVQIKDCVFPDHEKIGISFCTGCDHPKPAKDAKGMNHIFEWKTISMMEYAQHILDKINRYFSKNSFTLKENECILDYINHHEIITFREGAGYCVNYNEHQLVIPFLKAYLPCSGQTVNIAVYRDFIFSVVQIADFIDERLRSVKAHEYTIYHKLRSEAGFKVQMNHQFLTICN